MHILEGERRRICVEHTCDLIEDTWHVPDLYAYGVGLKFRSGGVVCSVQHILHLPDTCTHTACEGIVY